jgi:hypothetical protein
MKCIKETIITLLVVLSLGCKDHNEKTNKIVNNREKKSTVSIINSQKKQKNIHENWFFYKVVPLSNTYSCDSKKYEDFRFSISEDSIFIDNIYTDDVYRNRSKSESFFEHKYEFNFYKTFLPKNFNVKLPAFLENIRNKKAYQNDSKLDSYFQDAFFIDEYLFFKKDGCLYCFKKDGKNRIDTNNIKNVSLPISSTKISNPDFSIPTIDKKIVIDGSQATSVYKLKNDIFLLWFEGGTEKWYVVTLIRDKIEQQLLVGKSETVELGNGQTEDDYIDFFIDENLNIRLEYSKGKGYSSRKTYKKDFFFVSIDKKIIKK